jgi:hypothetical protein
MSEARSSEKPPSLERSAAAELANYCPESTVPGYWDTLETNAHEWAEQVSVSSFWKKVQESLPAWNAGFRKGTAAALMEGGQMPSFCAKGSGRTREKVYNKVKNGSADDLKNLFPMKGAAVPCINDLVRTRVPCLFLDGVEFLVDELEHLATHLGLPHSRERQGRLEGYFAQHFYFCHDVIFHFGGGKQLVTINCEVQVATMLSTRIWDATHQIYEKSRGFQESPDDWQWKPGDPRFLSRQLGHMIHLADGILVQLRNSTLIGG